MNRLPPFRRRFVPLPFFTLGYQHGLGGRVICCGWWGIKLGALA